MKREEKSKKFYFHFNFHNKIFFFFFHLWIHVCAAQLLLLLLTTSALWSLFLHLRWTFLSERPTTLKPYQVLSALAFLNKHEKRRDQLQFVLNEAIKPDVRNPAFIYWRLLSTDGYIAKQLLFTQVSSSTKASSTNSLEIWALFLAFFTSFQVILFTVHSTKRSKITMTMISKRDTGSLLKCQRTLALLTFSLTRCLKVPTCS